MECVTTVSYSILVNREPKGMIYPNRGIRQRDPLSPYLFLFCAKRLNAILRKASIAGEIEGFSLCRQGPKITHLFFVDDCLLFCHSTLAECEKIQDYFVFQQKYGWRVIGSYKTIPGCIGDLALWKVLRATLFCREKQVSLFHINQGMNLGTYERMEGEVSLPSQQGDHDQGCHTIDTCLFHECVQTTYKPMQGHWGNDMEVLVGARREEENPFGEMEFLVFFEVCGWYGV